MKQIVSEDIYQIRSASEIDFQNTHVIDSHNWGSYAEVEARFCIANDESNIYLKYKVSENNLIARYQEINEPVYKDSCVEFFISFDQENYYNFEFNSIGNVLAAHGKDRTNRTFLKKEVVKSLNIHSSLGKNKIQVLNRKIAWQLDIIIPLSTFYISGPVTLSGQKITCNFYKCGDDLPEPHYLSWNPIESDVPDFHKPEFFGELLFS